jgi:hypothetical protein
LLESQAGVSKTANDILNDMEIKNDTVGSRIIDEPDPFIWLNSTLVFCYRITQQIRTNVFASLLQAVTEIPRPFRALQESFYITIPKGFPSHVDANAIK